VDRQAIDDMLAATLEDYVLSRGEKHALTEVIREQGLDQEGYAFWRHRAFALARDRVQGAGPKSAQVLDWLEGVVKLLHPISDGSEGVARVCFSPGPECLRAIKAELDRAKSKVEICVFTITDDRVTDAILAAHRRKVKVRIATDDEKAYDRGSDVERLAGEGIEVRVDEPDHHMHHKFAVFDDARLVTGSYNWTRSAAERNQENVLVSDDVRLVRPYREMFDRLWSRLAPIHDR
jgi:phosphatidylserine/phosphatidylglycerophosphate/cardiolipin synthase-like enzyme